MGCSVTGHRKPVPLLQQLCSPILLCHTVTTLEEAAKASEHLRSESLVASKSTEATPVAFMSPASSLPPTAVAPEVSHFPNPHSHDRAERAHPSHIATDPDRWVNCKPSGRTSTLQPCAQLLPEGPGPGLDWCDHVHRSAKGSPWRRAAVL